MSIASRRTHEATPSRQASLTGTRIFLGGQALSVLGDGFALLAVPLLILELTHSALAAALAAAPRTVGYLLVGFVAGAVVDRIDPRRVMFLADCVRLGAFGLITATAAAGTADVRSVLLLAFLASAAGAFFECALSVTVKDCVPPEKLLRTNSFLESASQLSLVLGPAVIGALTALVGLQGALLVNTATFLVSLITLPGLRPARRNASGGDAPALLRGLLRDIRAGLAFIRADRTLATLTALQAAVNFTLGVETLMVFFSRDILGLTVGQTGIAVAAAGVGGIAGVLVAPAANRKCREARLVVLAVYGVACAVLAMTVVTSLWTLCAANFVLAAASTCASVVMRSLRQRITPRELLGRVTGAARVVSLATNPLGAGLAGIAAEWLDGPRPLFAAAGLAMLAAGCVASRSGLRNVESAVPSPELPSKK
ncbi:MFS transporter [Streptomyces sp. NPDC050619]|uniref:MFS transporter n=1 Tax=Streptomyces sp. NPDC050619 TaxID=3157214 RepID=UPI00343CD333